MNPPLYLEHNGVTYRLQSSGKYYQANSTIEPERLLHRRIWSDAHGEIPDGHSIHHKDHDWTNNDLDNLECIESREHMRQHMIERMQDDEYRAKTKENLLIAQEAAKKWHASPEGIEWHKQHAKEQWENKEQVELECKRCSSKFLSWMSDAMYCSRSCQQKGCYARQKTDKRICAWCNTEYLANKYRKSQCCSKLCANRKRGAEQKAS